MIATSSGEAEFDSVATLGSELLSFMNPYREVAIIMIFLISCEAHPALEQIVGEPSDTLA